MNIWIVEDDKNDAKKAFEVIEKIMPVKEAKVYWDPTLLWSADLEDILSAGEGASYCKLDHMPDIVVLDLLDADQRFAAGQFYERLRKEESEQELPASFVIAWSVKTGLPEVHRFFNTKPKVDRRLMFTNTKTTKVLEEMLSHCLKSWREARHL